MNSRDADVLAARILQQLADGQPEEGYALLAPALTAKNPFRLLDRIGTRIGAGRPRGIHRFLERVAGGNAIGAWPLIGSALSAQLETDFEDALRRCRAFIVEGGIWYAADTLAERVPGTALVTDIRRALAALNPWRTDPNRWVRKSCGVAVHLWAKRSRGEKRHVPKVRKLLTFLAPMFCEEDLDAAKGIGWGLKTLGRLYPETVAPWLVSQVGRARPFRPLLLRKAVTYLPAKDRGSVYRAARR
jgi:hypothetical protein